MSAAGCNLDSNQLGRIISSPHPIDAAAVANDPSAAEVFKEFGCQLGRALRKTLTLFSPDVVVFGGSNFYRSRSLSEHRRIRIARFEHPIARLRITRSCSFGKSRVRVAWACFDS